MEKYVPLKELVAMALDANNKSIKDFDKCWIIAFRALRQLNFSVAAEPKSCRLPVKANKTVDLPADYKALSKIGVVNDRGEIVSLAHNSGLSIFRDNNPNRLTQLFSAIGASSDPVVIPNTLYLNFYDNGSYSHLFGVGGGLITYGEYRLDEQNSVIVLNETFAYSDVIIEYISSPIEDGDYMVPECLSEAVIAFIEWKLKLGTEQAFYARIVEGRRSLPGQRVTLQQVHQVLRETGGQYLKA
jgi:hypothetical protein